MIAADKHGASSLQRLNYGAVHDDYVLGIVCGMCGLTHHCLSQNCGVRSDADRNRLFWTGVNEHMDLAYECCAKEFWLLWKKNPVEFMMLVGTNAGWHVWRKIETILRRYEPKENDLLALR